MLTKPKAISPIDALLRNHRLRWWEGLPWLAAGAGYFLYPDYLALGNQIFVMVLFALSLDLILGYAGIVTLGHAAFFGIGAYTAGILAVHGWHEPLTALVVAGAIAGAVGFASGLIILRTHGLTLLMLTLAIVFMLEELANKASWLTGGADGLQGMSVAPVFGMFRFDMFGRTAYWYSLSVLFLGWIVIRILVHSPFGRSLTGIRENVIRMHAIGTPVRKRLVIAYAISAVLAGVAGGVQAQTTQFVGLNVVSFQLSGAVLIMLIFGGIGRLYGAFVGAAIYMVVQDYLVRSDVLYWAKYVWWQLGGVLRSDVNPPTYSPDPAYWEFWLGLLLVLVVMFARGGVLGLGEQAWRYLRRKRT